MLFSYAVIQFSQEFFYAVSNPIIPFRILLFIFLILLCHYEFFLFSFQFYYSLSNYVMQFSSPIIRLYSPLMQSRILLFPFKFCWLPFQFYYAIMSSFRPRPHVSGDFCNRKFFYADTPSVHTCPPYTLGVSGDFCIRSPEWKFLYTLCIRIRVDARIRIFLYTLTSYDSYTLRVDADIFVTV